MNSNKMRKYHSLDEMLQSTIHLYMSDVGLDLYDRSRKREVYLAKAAIVNVVGGFFPSMSKVAPFFNMSRTNIIRIRDKHSDYMKNRYYVMCLYKALRSANYTGVGLVPTSRTIEKDVIKIIQNEDEHLQTTA